MYIEVRVDYETFRLVPGSSLVAISYKSIHMGCDSTGEIQLL